MCPPSSSSVHNRICATEGLRATPPALALLAGAAATGGAAGGAGATGGGYHEVLPSTTFSYHTAPSVASTTRL
jgi:hypothetical protein